MTDREKNQGKETWRPHIIERHGNPPSYLRYYDGDGRTVTVHRPIRKAVSPPSSSVRSGEGAKP